MFLIKNIFKSESEDKIPFFPQKTANLSLINIDGNTRFWINTSIAGGVSGCVAKTIIAPLDRIKILFQTSNPQYLKYSEMRFGFFFAGKNIWKKEGVRGLFQGHSATIIRVFPYTAIKFLSYEKYRNILIPNAKNDTGSRRFASGSLAGLTSVLFTYPLDIVRVRLAFEIQKQQKSFRKICSNIFDGSNSLLPGSSAYLQHIQEQKPIYRFLNTIAGFFNFYRGFTPTLLGILPYAGVSFWTHDFVTDFLRKKEFEKYTVVSCNSNKSFLTKEYPLKVENEMSYDSRYKRLPLKAWAELTAGGLAGLFSQTVAYPLEVIRRKMQISDVYGYHLRKGICETALDIWKTSGYRGFFIGLSINYLKAVPMISSSFFIYERLMHFFVTQ